MNNLNPKQISAILRWNDKLQIPTKEQLSLDKSNGLSQRSMCQKYGLSKPFIKKLLDQYGIDTSNPKTKFNKIDKTVLENEIFTNKLTLSEIAEKHKRTKSAIKHMISYYHIKVPDNRIHKTKRKLEKLQNDIVSDYGTLTKEQIENKYKIGQQSVDFALKDTPLKFFKASSYETELCDFLKSQGIYFVQHFKLQSGKEIDILIPEFKVGIEFHGLYWHSTLNSRNIDKQYHFVKFNESKQENIHLLQIFEDEWIQKKEIWKSIIKNKTQKPNIHGRKCHVDRITISECKSFLDANHLQGYCPAKFYYGLFHDSELISVMTFGKPRFNTKYEWELIRYANKLNHSVYGGASKLFNKFLKDINPKSIISYCDLRLSNGSVYVNLNFSNSHTSNPNYFYVRGKTRINRVSMQKHKLQNKLDVFDPNRTEMENMTMNGYGIIYDAGNFVFIWQK